MPDPALRAAVEGTTADQPPEGYYFKPKHGWTCFHCGETFTTPGSARDHFGADPLKDPGCRIKAGEERGLLMALRKAEAELDKLLAERCAEESEAERDHYRLLAAGVESARSAEEAGYAKALRDIEAGKVEREHAERIIAALRPIVECSA